MKEYGIRCAIRNCILSQIRASSTGVGVKVQRTLHRRREIPNLKSIIGVLIGQIKNVVKKVSPHSSSWRNTNLDPNQGEWSSWFTKLVF